MANVIVVVDLENGQHLSADILEFERPDEEAGDEFYWATEEDLDGAIEALQELKRRVQAERAVDEIHTLPEGFEPFEGPQSDLKAGDVLYVQLPTSTFYGGEGVADSWKGKVEVRHVDESGDVNVKLPQGALRGRSNPWDLETAESTWPAGKDVILGVERTKSWQPFDGEFTDLKVGDRFKAAYIHGDSVLVASYVEEGRLEYTVEGSSAKQHQYPSGRSAYGWLTFDSSVTEVFK